MAKNIGEGGKRDFEMAFSVFSPQLALNYLGRTLYKVSGAILSHTWVLSVAKFCYRMGIVTAEDSSVLDSVHNVAKHYFSYRCYFFQLFLTSHVLVYLFIFFVFVFSLMFLKFSVLIFLICSVF